MNCNDWRLTSSTNLIMTNLTQIDVKERENDETEDCVAKLTAELELLQLQLDNYTKRASNLERGKRLRTIFTTVAGAKSDSETNRPNIKSADSKNVDRLPKIESQK